MGTLFKKYGRLSLEELNTMAAELKTATNRIGLLNLAKENGIDKEDAMDYMNGDVSEFASPVMAALARIQIESEDMKENQEIICDWIEYIKMQCKDAEFAERICDKEKSILGCITEILKWSFKNKYDIDPEITKAAGISYKVQMGIPGSATVKKIIKKYYGGKK